MLPRIDQNDLRTRDDISDDDIKRLLRTAEGLFESYKNKKGMVSLEGIKKKLSSCESIFKKYATILKELHEFKQSLSSQPLAIALEQFLVLEVGNQTESKWEDTKCFEKGADSYRLESAINNIFSAADLFATRADQEYSEKWHVTVFYTVKSGVLIEGRRDFPLWNEFIQHVWDDFHQKNHGKELVRLLTQFGLNQDSQVVDCNDGRYKGTMDDRIEEAKSATIEVIKHREQLKKESSIWTLKNIAILFLDYLRQYAAKVEKQVDSIEAFETEATQLLHVLTQYRHDLLRPIYFDIYHRNFLNEFQEIEWFTEEVRQIKSDLALGRAQADNLKQEKKRAELLQDDLLLNRYSRDPEVANVLADLRPGETNRVIIDYYHTKALAHCRKLFQQENDYYTFLATTKAEADSTSAEAERLNIKIGLWCLRRDDLRKEIEAILVKIDHLHLNFPALQGEKPELLGSESPHLVSTEKDLAEFQRQLEKTTQAESQISENLAYSKRELAELIAVLHDKALQIAETKENFKTFFLTHQLSDDFQHFLSAYNSVDPVQRSQVSGPLAAQGSQAADPVIERGIRKRRIRSLHLSGSDESVLEVNSKPLFKGSGRHDSLAANGEILSNQKARSWFNWRTALVIGTGALLFFGMVAAAGVFSFGLAVPVVLGMALTGGLFGGGLAWGFKKILDSCEPREKKQLKAISNSGGQVRPVLGSDARLSSRLSERIAERRVQEANPLQMEAIDQRKEKGMKKNLSLSSGLSGLFSYVPPVSSRDLASTGLKYH